MAPRTKASKPAKRLGEILQQQQEPFILEIYLSERGCVRKKKYTSETNFSCFHGIGNSSKKFGSQNPSKKGIPHLSQVLKVVQLSKFFTIKGLRTKNCDDDEDVGKSSNSNTATEMDRNNQKSTEPDIVSSASTTTVYNSCSDSDTDIEPSTFAENSKSNSKLKDTRESKVASDIMFQWTYMDDSKQHSPQSVLQKLSTTVSSLYKSSRVSSTRQKNFFLPKLITQDSILSASLWNLLVQTTRADKTRGLSAESLRQPDWCNNSSPPPLSKKILQQKKQLLFDCVRELVDKHDTEEKGKECLGAEEIGKLISHRMKIWGKQRGHDSNINLLLETGVMETTQQWNGYESQKKDIGFVIGNAIAEELTIEFVIDIIDFR